MKIDLDEVRFLAAEIFLLVIDIRQVKPLEQLARRRQVPARLSCSYLLHRLITLQNFFVSHLSP
jgi:hypothetical protein